MSQPRVTKLSLIRHAPAQDGGCLAGRRDVPAHPGDPDQIAALQALLGAPKRLLASPALRCQQTSAMLWADLAPQPQPQLWEQDFGEWEGTPYPDLPDIGTLSTSQLAAHRPPQGESFNDLCARVGPQLQSLADDHAGEHLVVVCHAGVIRASLSWAGALGPAALGFAVEPLSLTQIEVAATGNRIVRVNWTCA